MRKATISFVMYVCPSVRMEKLGSHRTGFCEILNQIIFSKTCREKSKFHSNLTKNDSYFT